jgi:hypothetical protein
MAITMLHHLQMEMVTVVITMVKDHQEIEILCYGLDWTMIKSGHVTVIELVSDGGHWSIVIHPGTKTLSQYSQSLSRAGL